MKFFCKLRAILLQRSHSSKLIISAFIRPGEGGSEAQMTRLKAGNQKRLTLRCPNFVLHVEGYSFINYPKQGGPLLKITLMESFFFLMWLFIPNHSRLNKSCAFSKNLTNGCTRDSISFRIIHDEWLAPESLNLLCPVFWCVILTCRENFSVVFKNSFKIILIK